LKLKVEPLGDETLATEPFRVELAAADPLRAALPDVFRPETL
jgi:hypothetical protein